MSVSNPVDSGGLRAFDHDLQGLAEQMNTVGGWAEIMAADSMNNTVDDEEPTREAVIDQQSAGQITYRSQRNPPFKAQIIGVQDNMDLDELYLFLGGDTKILDIDYGSSESHRKTRAVVTMCTEEDLEELVANKQLSFNGKPLRAWPLNSGGSRQSDSRQDDFRSHRDTYSRQNSNFGSTTSLASSHHGGHNRYDRGNRYDYGSRGNRCDDGPSRGHYQTLPNDRGPRGHYNGRKNSRGDRFDGGYDQRRYGSDLMRSESYSNDKDRPAPIYRSRTDDGLVDRRSEMSSRANSQMSINQEPVRKPSNKDLFGDAKPVDSAKRLLELDEKEKQKKAEKEAEKQRFQHQQRMAQQHHQMPYSVYGHNYNIPPPNYVQPQPYYTIPQVPAFSGHASPAPGTIKIYQRDVSEREQAADMSPPLDPKHPTPTITEPQTKEHPIETIKEEPSPAIPHSDTTTQDKGPQMVIPRQSSGQSQPTNKPSFQKPRTFTRTTDARRSRGGFQGGSSQIDLTVESNSASEKNNNKEGATGQSSDSRLSRDNKEMHGSQASLASKRGGFRGGRGGRGGNRDRPPRERRPSREDHQKSAHGKEKNQSQQQRKTSRDEEPKAQPSISQTAPKSDVKNDVVKQEIPLSTPKAETAPAAGPVDAKEKKKEKKKKANAAKNNSTPLGSNKFSVLLEE